MKRRKSRDVGSVFKLRKRHYKQMEFSQNNNTTLPWKRNTKINVPKEGVTTDVKIFDKLLHLDCSG